MTNQEIVELARSKGYKAFEDVGYVEISLDNRRLTRSEIERELDIPYEVTDYGTCGSIRVWGVDA